MTGDLIRREEGQTQRQRSEGCGHKPRISWGLGELEEARKDSPHRVFGRSMALQTPGLQDC